MQKPLPPKDLTKSQLTSYLKKWSSGENEAFEALLPLVYKDLKAAANHYISSEKKNHTLQPTALINEVYLRLQSYPNVNFNNRAQFFFLAGKLMRQILVEHARAKSAAKRGGGQTPLSLDEAMAHGVTLPDLDTILTVEAALQKLEAMDPRQAQIVEYRFFAGFTTVEIAAAMDLSESTVMREWRVARLWFAKEIADNTQ